MADDTSAPEPRIDASPAEIRRRTDERLLTMRSVWFPSPREDAAWRASGHPVYIRWIGPNTAEVGPRFDSLWVSSFAPVDVVDVSGPIAPVRRLPHVTTAVLVGWWVAAAAWAAYGLPRIASGDEPAAWLFFFGTVVGASTLGPGLGWVMGGRALDAARGVWLEAMRVPRSGEDW